MLLKIYFDFIPKIWGTYIDLDSQKYILIGENNYKMGILAEGII